MKLSFYNRKKVFITGHTGFKGSWLCKILMIAGAEVTGYSLDPPTEPALYRIADIERGITSIIGDIRDINSLEEAITKAQPEIVFHLAAQPIVRDSYKKPVYTFETNVMGTVNILECIRNCDSVKSVLNVTTDKVYMSMECELVYRENEMLDGYDPYSNSKSCSELVTHSYKSSFLDEKGIAVSTARAGNVIGGGDFANDRIIPDCVRAALKHQEIQVRNPYSIRPYQHVLEPLFAYLMIAAKQYEDGSYAGYYNVGPDEGNCLQTGDLVDSFIRYWGENLTRTEGDVNGPHEANYLKLDCSKIKRVFDWKPCWTAEKAVEKTVKKKKNWREGLDINQCMEKQIQEYGADWPSNE